ncbi:hypothetical protein C8F04DRAFT_1261158 [Mycena alexandri]|uniref:aspartate kinase n=1 Tax=Mycena alexandri TaxID=1745969 RepID=A0AAD6X2A5_9AGAR|nr:hypothetical protein C8F04DRAFT_1261158 [Mycena alexandri]
MLSSRASEAMKQLPRHPTARLARISCGDLSTLDRFGVVVDLISTSEVHVSMAIEDGLAKKLLERLLRELQKAGTVSVHHDMAILSLVGKHMCNMIGIAGRMFTTLAQGKVNIEMISQGASEINISCSCLQLPDTLPTPKGIAVGPWLF